MPRSQVDPRPESAEGLEALVSDLIFWVDQELCILRSNATAQRLLRHEPDVLHGLAFEGLIAPPSRRTFATFVAERRAQGGPSTRPIEVRLQMHETPELPVEIALHASEFAGKPAWLIVARDLSDRRQLRAERNRTESLEEANSALREAMLHAEQTTRVKTEFLANVSHEIRTPMTAILGFTEELLVEARRSDGPPATIDALRTIQRNGDYLLALLNDILDLSKIESGRLEVEHVTFSPVAVVRDVERLMRVRAEGKGVGFTVEFGGEVPAQAEGDPTRVRQILINLVGNAIKFTEIGEVRLRVQLRDEPAPRPSASRSSTRVSGSPRPSAASCSARSGRPTARPRAATAAPASVSPSRSASRTCSTARSRSRASPATEPPSGSSSPPGTFTASSAFPHWPRTETSSSRTRWRSRACPGPGASCSSRTAWTTSASSRCSSPGWVSRP